MKIDEPHLRRCFDCGTTNEHQSRVTPGVLCPKCGSQDTRHIPTRTKPMTVAELLAHEGDSPTELAMQAAIRDLVARVEASQLVWTDAKPTVPGWWWMRFNNEAEAAYCVHVFISGERKLYCHWNQSSMPINGRFLSKCQFAGPILPPVET